MPPSAVPSVQAPYFFLSYTRSHTRNASARDEGEDKDVTRFFLDLCQHIRHLTDLDKDIDPGFMDRTMHAATEWPAKVKDALATCQTFIALYEPAYFRSEWCGYEWAAFQARQDYSRPPGSLDYQAIIPVLWVEEDLLPNPMPYVAKDLQYTDPLPPPRYRAEGVYGLRHGFPLDYRKTTLAIARRIASVANYTRIPRCPTSLFVDGANAFTQVAPKTRGRGAIR